jgi:plasmid stabilization system protein ParE
MTYRIIIEPAAEREIRSAVRWKAENAAPAVAARWYNGLIKKIETLQHELAKMRALCLTLIEKQRLVA